MLYLSTFGISVLLMALAEKRKSKVYFWLLSAAALLLPCMLAALRAEQVGTDVRHYLKPMLELASTSGNYMDFLRRTWSSSIGVLCVGDYEYGFTLMVYAVAKLFGNLRVLMFTVEAAILVPVYIALTYKRGKLPAWLGMLVYYLVFYNAGLNLMRQLIAMSLLLLAFRMMLEKKWILAFLLSGGSLLFHYSALLMIPIYAVYFLLRILQNCNLKLRLGKHRVSVWWPTIAASLIGAVCFAAVFFMEPIAKILPSLGLSRFDQYIMGGPASVMSWEILRLLPILALFMWYWKAFKDATKDAAFYLCMLLVEIAASQLVSINAYTYRIPMYFSAYTVLGLPSLYRALENRNERIIVTAVAALTLLGNWYYLNAYLLLNETWPYAFLG